MTVLAYLVCIVGVVWTTRSGKPLDMSDEAREQRRAARVQKKLDMVERRRLVGEALLAGRSSREIGRHFGVSHVTVLSDFDQVLADGAMKTTAKLSRVRQMWLLRLEKLWAGIYPNAMKGDARAVEAAVKIVERAARLLGADRPLKIASTTPDGDQWAPLAASLSKLTTEELGVLHKLRRAELDATTTTTVQALPPGTWTPDWRAPGDEGDE